MENIYSAWLINIESSDFQSNERRCWSAVCLSSAKQTRVTTIKTNAGPAGLGRATTRCHGSGVEKLDDLSRPRCTKSPQLSHLRKRAAISEKIARGPITTPRSPIFEISSCDRASKQTVRDSAHSFCRALMMQTLLQRRRPLFRQSNQYNLNGLRWDPRTESIWSEWNLFNSELLPSVCAWACMRGGASGGGPKWVKRAYRC